MKAQPYHLCFESLANEMRIKILALLRERPYTVNELTARLGVERSRISHSLQMLRDCRIISAAKQGKHRLYSLNKDSPLTGLKVHSTMFTIIDDHIGKFCQTCWKLEGGSPHKFVLIS